MQKPSLSRDSLQITTSLKITRLNTGRLRKESSRFTDEKFFLREKYHCIIIPIYFLRYTLIIR